MSRLLQVPIPPTMSKHHGSDTTSLYSRYSDDSAFLHSNRAPSTRATSPGQQTSCLPTMRLHEDVPLLLDNTGRAIFDYQRQDGAHIAPRQVTDLHWYTEQSGEMDEYITLKVVDSRHHEEIWTRFRAYSGGGVRGDVAYSQGAIVPRDAARHASLEFVDGIEYRHVVDTVAKMNRLFRTSIDQEFRASRTAAFIGMLSLCIGKGVGQCSPRDLCEIWPSVPDSDRRLHGFQWYEVADGSGTEYLVLHVAGTADYTTSETDNWWVRLERTEMIDQATFSANQKLVVHPNSELKHQMTFDAGIPFDKVIAVLDKVPTGFNYIIEDCWFYASTIAHKLSMEVGDDLCECRAEDLREIWSGERGSQMLVNRIQCFQPEAGTPPDYLLLNVSLTKHDSRGVWVRLGQMATLGQEENWAAISRNRRRLIQAEMGSPSGGVSTMLVDIAFETLKYGEVTSELRKLNQAMAMQNPIRASCAVQPVELIRKIVGLPNKSYYCVSGNVNDLLDGFAY